MKKYLKYCLLCFLSFHFFIINVDAKMLNSDDVPNSTYIIGTHMFTRDINDETGYNGQLTTQFIMLASKTISGNDLSNMIIYQKTARGKWVNALNNTTITPPQSFNINYKNNKEVIEVPTISSDFSEYSKDGMSYTFTFENIDSVDGVSLYYGKDIDSTDPSTSTLFKTININEIVDGKLTLTIPYGLSGYFSARTYKEHNGKIIYSDYSNWTDEIDTTLKSMTISAYGIIIGSETQIGANYELLLSSSVGTTQMGYCDGVEVYYSNAWDGEFSLLKKVPISEIKENKIVVTAPFGYENVYKLRIYKVYNDKTVYGKYSNKMMINSTFPTPTISNYNFEGMENNDLTYSFKITNFKNTSMANPTGVEIYYATEEDKEYALLTTSEIRDDKVYFKLKSGNHYYFKVRSYFEAEEKIYSDFSNIKEIEFYNITYDLNGGVNKYAEGKYLWNIYYTEYDLIINGNVEKEGYVFIGWTGSNGSVPELEVTIPSGTTGNLSYTANWALPGDVNQDGAVDNLDMVQIERYIDGGYELPEIVIANIIAGDVNQDGEVDDVDVSVLEKYIAGNYGIDKLPYNTGNKYNIKYDLNGGSLGIGTRNIKTYAEISLPFKLKKPIKEGYVFVGWTGSNGSVPELEVTIPSGTTGDLSYTANWALPGDVNQDGAVDNLDMVQIERYIDGGYELPEIVIANILAGDVNQDGEVDDVDVSVLEKYIAGNYGIDKLPYNTGNKYNIKYDLNGGSLGIGTRNIKTYAEISLPFKLKKPIKEGYVFAGWTGSNGSVPELEVTIPSGTTGNLSYTANWNKQ